MGTSRRRSPQTALNLLEVDRFGLDEIDQKIMRTVLEKFGGGPVGINTIAASIGEEPETIEEVYEPYLIQLGFLHRSPRGRMATERRVRLFQSAAAVRRDGAAAGVVLKRSCLEACVPRARLEHGRSQGPASAMRFASLRLPICSCEGSRAFTKRSRSGCANKAGF